MKMKTMTQFPVSTKARVLLSYIALAGMTMLCALVSRSAIAFSPVALDFENLLVFSSTAYLYLGAVISLSLGLFIYANWQANFADKQEVSVFDRLIYLVISNALVFGFLFFFPLETKPLWTSLGVASFTFIVDLFIKPRERNISWLIGWLIVLSAYLSMTLFDGYLQHDLNSRKELAQELYHVESDQAVVSMCDVMTELQLNPRMEQLLSVPSPFKMHRSEFDFINKEILQGELAEGYEYLFNAYNQAGENMIYECYTPMSYYEEQKRKSDTISGNIFFDPIKNVYLTSWIYESPTQELGPFTIFLEQYPSDVATSQTTGTALLDYLGKYDYVYYKKTKVASYSNPFLVELEDANLDLEEGEYWLETNEQYSSLFYKVSNDRVIKLSRKSAHLIKPVSLFSFLFLYIGCFLFVANVVNLFYKFLPTYLSIQVDAINLLKNKLQFSIISLIIFSFIVIGVVTIFYFQNISKEYDKDLLRESAVSIALDFNTRLSGTNDPKMAIGDLNSSLTSIANLHHVNLNIFDTEGKLKLSTLPKLYEKDQYSTTIQDGVLGTFTQNSLKIKIDPMSSYAGQSFQHAYFPIVNSLGQTTLIVHSLHAPIIKSNSKVSDFVGTLLNIYVFLFLIAAAISLAVSNYITKPLKRLGDKIKALKLGSKNEPLEWNSNDDLGHLVNNYNEMLSKLDDSAKLIAHTERDMAWREMAKQVAHEIKNPLTPMKLSIQYLQRAIDQQPENMPFLVDRVSRTLIEQIDNLSNIAGAFSNFGKMPQASNEKVVLNEIVEAIHDLFRKRNDMEINMYEPIDELFVFADKNALLRILNNIVKNAIQAIPTDRRGYIDVRLYKKDAVAIVQITDNGIGISEERKEKVFLPNFTTKSSGTGLGLAICANMVESFNGRLYFESTEGVGTDFFVEIPLMHVNDNFIQEERVVLD